MRPRIPLPDDLTGRSFDRAAARRAGVPPGRLRRKDVRRPFRGVQSTGDAESIRERCHEYAVRLKPGQFFTHGTAALLLGLPVPRSIEEDETLHLGAVRPADAPHAKGVVGHRLQHAVSLLDVQGLPSVDGPESFCQLAPVLGVEDLVVIADRLLDLLGHDEATGRARLLLRVDAHRRTGGGRLVRAAHDARLGSRSPAETRVRLVIQAAGLPAPELNAPIHDLNGRYLGSPDFVWRRQRVLLEYEGDGHRERDQFRYDIARYEALTAAGWRVVRATADDLTPSGRTALVTRLATALAASR